MQDNTGYTGIVRIHGIKDCGVSTAISMQDIHDKHHIQDIGYAGYTGYIQDTMYM